MFDERQPHATVIRVSSNYGNVSGEKKIAISHSRRGESAELRRRVKERDTHIDCSENA